MCGWTFPRNNFKQKNQTVNFQLRCRCAMERNCIASSYGQIFCCAQHATCAVNYCSKNESTLSCLMTVWKKPADSSTTLWFQIFHLMTAWTSKLSPMRWNSKAQKPRKATWQKPMSDIRMSHSHTRPHWRLHWRPMLIRQHLPHSADKIRHISPES